MEVRLTALADLRVCFARTERAVASAFAVGTGDVEPDYVNGSLSLGLQATITDPIVYYGFWPQVGVAAFMAVKA